MNLGFNKESYADILGRSNEKQYIRYSLGFTIIYDLTKIPPNEFETLIKNKIVILGFLGNEETQEEDVHYTHNGKMYGANLIANKVYTLLVGSVSSLGIWCYMWFYLILLVCLLFLVKIIKKSIMGYLLLKIVQLLFAAGVVFIFFAYASKSGVLTSTSGFIVFTIFFPEVLFWVKKSAYL